MKSHTRSALPLALLLAACAGRDSSKPADLAAGAAAANSGVAGYADGSTKADGGSGAPAPAPIAGGTAAGTAGLNAGAAGRDAAVSGSGPSPAGAAAGAAAAAGSSGSDSAAAAGNAGANGTAGASAGGMSGSAGAAGPVATNGMCLAGQTKPNEVLFIGDSFIAINNSIPMTVEADARAAGVLGQTDRYRNNAVSGTTLASGQIPNQYNKGVTAGPVKLVLMNGGGNDCLQANNPNGAYTAAMTLFKTMAEKNTESVIYFFYPDPLGGFAGSGLKNCLDMLRPQMKMLCEGLTAPKCYFLDLREGWMQSHTSDGIHPTAAGGKFVGDKIWGAMKEHCLAQ